MPIKINSDLPACKVLEKENIFVMTEKRALTTLFRSAREAYNTGKSQPIWHTSVSSRGRV